MAADDLGCTVIGSWHQVESWLIRMHAPSKSAALEVPVCSGRGRVWVDGKEVPALPGPLVVALPPNDGTEHEVIAAVRVSAYERRIVCGSEARAGSVEFERDGLGSSSHSLPRMQR